MRVPQTFRIGIDRRPVGHDPRSHDDRPGLDTDAGSDPDRTDEPRAGIDLCRTVNPHARLSR